MYHHLWTTPQVNRHNFYHPKIFQILLHNFKNKSEWKNFSADSSAFPSGQSLSRDIDPSIFNDT